MGKNKINVCVKIFVFLGRREVLSFNEETVNLINYIYPFHLTPPISTECTGLIINKFLTYRQTDGKMCCGRHAAPS